MRYIKKPKISVVVVFFNMRREATRTLYSLSVKYQKDISIDDYEVIILDSNSKKPLDKSWVESIQANFRYLFVETKWPSPCRAMNTGIKIAKSEHVVCMIDGARIASPGILTKMLKVNLIYPNAFIHTLGMHIGNELQNIAMEKGYNQKIEDELIKRVPWKNDGYKLFDISCLGGSSAKGFLYPIPECNCFSISKNKILEIGGFDEEFKTEGGGIVNHDTLNRLLIDEKVVPIMLLSEATFHQFHGGVASNVPMHEHKMDIYQQEYSELRGEAYKPVERQLIFFGEIRQNVRKFLK